jgi:hypothetical protein
VRNGNSGGVTRHIYPTSISTCQVTDHDHDRTKDSSVVNDGSVIDWARIRNGTTSNALSATTLSTSQQVALSTAGVTALQDASTTGHTTSGTIGGDIHTALTANSVSPFIVDDDHTWSFDSRTQITSPDILTESVGEATIYKAVDFSEALTANGSIGSITEP